MIEWLINSHIYICLKKSKCDDCWNMYIWKNVEKQGVYKQKFQAKIDPVVKVKIKFIEVS